MPSPLSKQPLSATSIKTLLAEAEAHLRTQGIDTPRLDAEVLLAHTLMTDRAYLFARLSSLLTHARQEDFQHRLERRARREPLAYITGTREFWSLDFRVTPEVLIPRPETEILVETALRLVTQSAVNNPQSPLCVLDVGTGSGCIAITLAKELPLAELWASDVSQTALAVALENAQRHGVDQRIRFLQSDLFSTINRNSQSFDLIISNPPYISHTDLAVLQPEVRDWEPQGALDGGRDGLEFYRRLVKESPTYLRSGGYLVMELGAGQYPAVMRLLQAQGNFQESFSVQDYAGLERVVVAHRCIG
ncbi:MAG: peptide chain release factor N(5)-glutamine methyltransferase [Candidatus Binatia bacterium]